MQKMHLKLTSVVFYKSFLRGAVADLCAAVCYCIRQTSREKAKTLQNWKILDKNL